MRTCKEIIQEKLQHSNIICSCEGSAERAIVDLLIENRIIAFPADNLVNKDDFAIRGAKKIEEKYLRIEYPENKPAIILRICDSRNEKFTLSKVYRDRIEVINLYTRPEIESLIIINAGVWDEYLKYESKMRPNVFCKTNLKMHNVKKYDFVHEYFSDVNVLKDTIQQYHHKRGKMEQDLSYLIK